MQIAAFNLVFMSGDAETAAEWNRFYLYATLLFLPSLLHFAFVFPHGGRLGAHRLLVAALYGTGVGALIAARFRESFFIEPPVEIARLGVWTPSPRPVLLFLISFSFTIAVITLLMRYIFTELETTQKRLFFVTFALASFALYNDAGDVWLNTQEFLSTFHGYDDRFWRLTLASDAFLFLMFFALLVLLGIRARRSERRTEAVWLYGLGLLAVATGFLDTLLVDHIPHYPTTLFLWRIFAAALMFYAILRYQLFDLHVRIRSGVRYGTMTASFAAVFFVVTELVKDFGGRSLGYFAGLAAAAGLILLFSPLQSLMDRFSRRVVPGQPTESYERFRTMEIYKAALEGALIDRVVSPAESESLRRLRQELGILDADHALLERDVRDRLEKRPA